MGKKTPQNLLWIKRDLQDTIDAECDSGLYPTLYKTSIKDV